MGVPVHLPLRRFARRALALALGLGLLGAQPAAADPAAVRSVALTQTGAETVLVIETDRSVRAPRVFFLEGPDRFVVDLPDTRWARAGAGPGAGVAARRRFANRPDGAARLVLDLIGPARLIDQRVERRGRRLVFAFAAASPAPEAAPSPPPRPLIVIDPGHGGRDPGAVNQDGVREKDLVLAAAGALRAALVRRGYDVALTREDDRFIELEDRVAFARERHAALFISLHADSVPGSRASGAAVYVLSERGAARSRSLMDRQDWDVDLGEAQTASNDVRSILVSLAQRETTNRSADFARSVLRELGEAGAPLWRRHPSNAGFFVLLAPDVPAVLVEMGFLTNPTDAARLADPGQQARFAEALAEAVDGHFAAPMLTAARR